MITDFKFIMTHPARGRTGGCGRARAASSP
jgi:hypothetical protein